MDNPRLEEKLSLGGYVILTLAYPAGYYFHYYFENFHILDSLYIRFGFSLFCILILILDKIYNSFILQRKLFQLLHVTTLLYSHYLVYNNSLGLSYILGLAIIIINVMSLSTSKRFLDFYFGLNLAAALGVFVFIKEYKENPMLFLLTIIFLTFFAYKNRKKDLNFLSKLLLKEQRELQVIEDKNLFFARIIHEIRNPINAIIAIIEELKEKKFDSSIQTEIDILNNSTELLLNLLNDLLDLSKLEQGNIEFKFSPCSPKRIAEEVYYLFAIRAKRKGLQVEFEFFGDDLLYNGEPIRIKQILMNLFNNAINYTESGKILLYVSSTKQGNLLHSTYKVYDTGKGILEQDKEKVFQKFFRADQTVKGAGLGLYISKTLAELMCGSLTYESPPSDRVGFSTVFILELHFPIVENYANNINAVYESLPIKRILVIDDDEINLLVISQILKSLRLNFSFTKEPFEGLNLAFSVEHDFIFVDLEMPKINGFEIAKRIRLTENLSKNAKIVAITGYEASLFSEKERGVFDAFLTKPISKDSLFKTLKKIIYEPPTKNQK